MFIKQWCDADTALFQVPVTLDLAKESQRVFALFGLDDNLTVPSGDVVHEAEGTYGNRPFVDQSINDLYKTQFGCSRWSEFFARNQITADDLWLPGEHKCCMTARLFSVKGLSASSLADNLWLQPSQCLLCIVIDWSDVTCLTKGAHARRHAFKSGDRASDTRGSRSWTALICRHW